MGRPLFSRHRRRIGAVALLVSASVWLSLGCGGSSSKNGDAEGLGGGNAVAGASGFASTAGSPAGDSGGAMAEGPFPSSRAIDTATLTIAGAACARLFACCEASYLDVLGYSDEVDCRGKYSVRLSGAVNANRSAIEAGRLAVHLEVADSCAGDLSCNGSPFRCSNLFQPLVADGGNCVFATECLSGSCNGSPKTCKQPQPSGGNCTFDEDCISHQCRFLVCKGDTLPEMNQPDCRQ